MMDEGESTAEDESIEKESTDEEQNMDNYDETQYLDIQNPFKLKEMDAIVECIA